LKFARISASLRPRQITYANGSLIKTDSLFGLCYPVQIAPAAVCQNGVMDYVLHLVEPLTIGISVAGIFGAARDIGRSPIDPNQRSHRCRVAWVGDAMPANDLKPADESRRTG
jgi:hypothetical protein